MNNSYAKEKERRYEKEV